MRRFTQLIQSAQLAPNANSATYVTSLPTAPVDGQEVYYQSTTSGTFDGTSSMATAGAVWHLRYRAASSSSYKWEWIGGADLRCLTYGGNTGTSGTFADLASGTTPSVVLPLTGDYQVMIGAGGVLSPSGSREFYMSVRATGYSPTYSASSGSLADNFIRFVLSNGNPASGMNYITSNLTGISGTIKPQYACGGPYDVTFNFTYIVVKPIRVG